jgi:autoinducer 2 (AI-2) kinase
MYVCGGSCKSDLWVEILANVMNLPIVVPVHAEGSALGAAVCAGVGAGAYGDFRQGIDALVKPKRVAEPNVEAVDQYNALFEKWMQVRGVLAQIPVGF